MPKQASFCVLVLFRSSIETSHSKRLTIVHTVASAIKSAATPLHFPICIGATTTLPHAFASATQQIASIINRLSLSQLPAHTHIHTNAYTRSIKLDNQIYLQYAHRVWIQYVCWWRTKREVTKNHEHADTTQHTHKNTTSHAQAHHQTVKMHFYARNAYPLNSLVRARRAMCVCGHRPTERVFFCLFAIVCLCWLGDNTITKQLRKSVESNRSVSVANRDTIEPRRCFNRTAMCKTSGTHLDIINIRRSDK